MEKTVDSSTLLVLKCGYNKTEPEGRKEFTMEKYYRVVLINDEAGMKVLTQKAWRLYTMALDWATEFMQVLNSDNTHFEIVEEVR